MTWHADTDTLSRYARGQIDEAAAFSLEAHLPGCPLCRSALASMVDRAGLEKVWREVVYEVSRPRDNGLERLLARVGVPDHLGRLMAATPSLGMSWVLAVAAALGFAVLAARTVAGEPLLFLAIAPLVPVAGVGTAYGVRMDPVHEIGLASPTGGFRLTLIRATAVLFTSVALAGVAALGLPDLGWTAVAWLLPSLALTVSTLALSTAMSPYPAATAVTIAWLTGVLVTERLATESLAAFGSDAQAFFAAMTIAAVLLVVARRDAFDLRNRV